MMRTAFFALTLFAASLASAQVKVGTPVKLILLKQLSSGEARVGETVPFVVSEDVKDKDGQIAIYAGTLATARITHSRREGALSASILDRPARLTIAFEKTWTPDGKEIYLRAEQKKRQKELLINRERAQLHSRETEELAKAWRDEHTRKILQKVSSLFTSDPQAISEEEFEELNRDVPLPDTQAVVRGHRLPDLLSLTKRLTTFPATRDSFSPEVRTGVAVLSAVRELARLAGNSSTFLGGRLKGRNITAPVGVELTAYVDG